MAIVSLIFPHQLFTQHPAIKKNQPIYLIEEHLFFKQYNFHQQKLVLHRASMQCYADYLTSNGYSVNYIESIHEHNKIEVLINSLTKKGIVEIEIAEVVDNWLHKKITSSCATYGIALTIHQTPNFINSMQDVQAYFDKKKTYFQTGFYIEQRKKLDILVDSAQQPIGGKWTFDDENRDKFPKDAKAPKLHPQEEDKYIKEAKKYVAKNFGNNYGTTDNFIYPINFTDAEKWLQQFFKERFEKFGVYEDAIVANECYLHHSVLSPLINIGLLQPLQIVQQALAFAEKHKIPLNSLEGFIRQIIGWREFIRIVYEREGSKQRTKNYWGFERKIPASFWTGKTGIAPIDNVINKALQTGYNHHIERLMVMGNFMLLCEFDPNEVHKWFMEMYVDAYDWVMVPNVYGMTQFADGGLMTTKPYISGSNYLLKMSDYKTALGSDKKWEPIWDGLFWRFMHINRTFFLKNPRLGMLVKTFDKMPPEKQQAHLNNAEKFLQQLDFENANNT
jgi:deoxyribodipyrimidine photolyase-related protein